MYAAVLEGRRFSQAPVCSKVHELRQFYQMTWGKYIVPCRQFSKVSYIDIDYPTTYYNNRLNSNISKNYFYVALEFPRRMFKEIELFRSFDIEQLLGNAGGYIGVCLGYSFLQLPCFMRALYTKCRQYFSHNPEIQVQSVT